MRPAPRQTISSTLRPTRRPTRHPLLLIASLVVLVVLAAASGCTAGLRTARSGATPTARSASPVCDEPGFDKQDLTLSCGAVTYDLLKLQPVRSARIFDLLSRETFTRRYYVLRAGGKPYSVKTEQAEGAPYPHRILLETGRGFRVVLLDRQGNVVLTERTRDLGSM